MTVVTNGDGPKASLDNENWATDPFELMARKKHFETNGYGKQVATSIFNTVIAVELPNT